MIDVGLHRGEGSEVRTLSRLHKNSWNCMYRGNYAKISHQERKVESHSLETNPVTEKFCDICKV